jgi:hypothetical protein
MIVTVALRNLLYDRLRLLATLAGVAFSVILMAGQTAIYVGASRTITTMIDRSRADRGSCRLARKALRMAFPCLPNSIDKARCQPLVLRVQRRSSHLLRIG